MFLTEINEILILLFLNYIITVENIFFIVEKKKK